MLSTLENNLQPAAKQRVQNVFIQASRRYQQARNVEKCVINMQLTQLLVREIKRHQPQFTLSLHDNKILIKDIDMTLSQIRSN